MNAITKGEITIREMKKEDVASLVHKAQLSRDVAKVTIRELKKQIEEKDELSDLLFVILYQNKVVGKIDIIFTDEYIKDFKYKGIKTDGNMIIEIPEYSTCMKIANDVANIFVEYCKEIGFVDVLGIPNIAPNGKMMWNPIQILP